ncbi:MAG: glycosyltransferase family 2 protein [Candidatus Moraniibacteriota bacterium]|nr:MAG: glycosyltransferase family 2 protein [Candidatus Moranbacteria bacterium]
MSSSKNNAVASAILATYNSEKTIVAALSSLLTQTVPIEVIVVDDGSTDDTRKVIKNFPNILVLSQSHQGPAKARNLGAKHAKSNVLLFVDADMTFDKNYVEKLIAPILKGEVIGTYTVKEYVANWESPLARSWNIQEGWADKLRFPANPPKYGTDYRAILKSEFERVGGFDDIGYTDTWSLFNKLGVRPLSTDAICYHKNPDSFATVYRQARWAAKRPYKHGLFGTLYALLRASFPVSLVVGVSKSIRHNNYYFLPFKIVFDFGRFVGILEMITTGKLSK